MGCVAEPYLAGTPEVAVFIGRFIFEGFTFGESAYASQAVLSWQTTVVGDPLYRPFGKSPEKLHDELLRTQSKQLEWSYLRLVNLNLANRKPIASVVNLLEELELTKHSAVLSEKQGDLYLAQGKPSSAVYTYMRALKLDPSPLQRLRLTLVTGQQLETLDRNQEAFDIYEKLLQDFPDYADRLAICKQLSLLARKLNHTAAVEKYENEVKALSPAASL